MVSDHSENVEFYRYRQSDGSAIAKIEPLAEVGGGVQALLQWARPKPEGPHLKKKGGAAVGRAEGPHLKKIFGLQWAGPKART